MEYEQARYILRMACVRFSSGNNRRYRRKAYALDFLYSDRVFRRFLRNPYSTANVEDETMSRLDDILTKLENAVRAELRAKVEQL